jgi:AAA+ ATPase superfamily predicted ATPase
MISGRSQELKYLNNYYERSGSQIIVMYGAAGVGKQEIVRDFVGDKPHYAYRARPASEREQLYQWGGELARAGQRLPKYPTFSDIFTVIMDTKRMKKVLVISDFQYIVKNSPTFVPTLIEMAHSRWSEGQVLVILTSSQIGWVENSMVGKIGEQAYELSGFLKVKELAFYDLARYFCAKNQEENIEAYAVLGGNPGLWQHFAKGKTTAENIIANILPAQAFLHGHGERMVAEMLRETGVYNTILSAIAAGHQRLHELYLHTGFSRAKISVYLKNLMELELVEKVQPPGAQKGHYRIANHFVHFTFTYIYPYLSDLLDMSPAEFYQSRIEPTFRSYVSGYFRTVCVARLEQWNREGKLPLSFNQSSEWAGAEGTIDIIATAGDGKTLLGLCSFEKSLLTYDDYEWLMFCAEKAGLTADYVYLFSGGRFDEKLRLEAKVKPTIRLIGVDEL